MTKTSRPLDSFAMRSDAICDGFDKMASIALEMAHSACGMGDPFLVAQMVHLYKNNANAAHRRSRHLNPEVRG